MARQRRARGQRRDYARSQRVGELLREIIAEELERIDDERLVEVAITGVEVDNELSKAVVFYDALDADPDHQAALVEHRGRLRSAIGEQARLRRTPDLVFEPDPSISAGARVDQILAGLTDVGPDDRAGAEDGLESEEDSGSGGPEGQLP